VNKLFRLAEGDRKFLGIAVAPEFEVDLITGFVIGDNLG
jgi:hypothetical protein